MSNNYLTVLQNIDGTFTIPEITLTIITANTAPPSGNTTPPTNTAITISTKSETVLLPTNPSTSRSPMVANVSCNTGDLLICVLNGTGGGSTDLLYPVTDSDNTVWFKANNSPGLAETQRGLSSYLYAKVATHDGILQVTANCAASLGGAGGKIYMFGQVSGQNWFYNTGTNNIAIINNYATSFKCPYPQTNSASILIVRANGNEGYYVNSTSYMANGVVTTILTSINPANVTPIWSGANTESAGFSGWTFVANGISTNTTQMLTVTTTAGYTHMLICQDLFTLTTSNSNIIGSSANTTPPSGNTSPPSGNTTPPPSGNTSPPSGNTTPPSSNVGASPNFKYATGFGMMPADYVAHPSMPTQGNYFDDAYTGARIQRLTDSSTLGTAGASFPSAKIMYSQFAPDSYDGKYLLVEDPNGNLIVVDAVTGSLIRKLGATENRSPRWDYSGNDPSVLYYTGMSDGKLYSQDVSTGVSTLVHDFSDLIAKYPPANGIFMDGHADTDDKSRLFPIQILCFDPTGGSWYALALALYDRIQDKVVGIIDSTNVPTDPSDPTHPLGNIHSAPFSLSRDGKYVAVQWSAPATGSVLVDTTRDGAHCYPITFDANNNPTGIDIAGGKRVNPSGGAHMCWAYGTDGKCYYVCQNTKTDNFEAVDPAVGIGPRSGDTTQNLTIKIVYNGTIGWNSQVHFSAPYRGPKGFIAMLFDGPGQYDTTQCGSNQTYVFPIAANSVPLRISPTYHTNPGTGKTGDNYDDQHYGSFSQDGQKFYWASNWCDDSGQRDVFVISLPTDWQTHSPPQP